MLILSIIVCALESGITNGKKGGISNSSCLPSMNQQIPSFFQVDVSFSFNFEKK